MKLMYKVREMTRMHKEPTVAVGLAVAAAVAIKIPGLFGIKMDPDTELPSFYIRNASFFVLPFLTAYFAWKRRLDRVTLCWLAMSFITAFVFANVYPFAPHTPGNPGYTETLTALHLPIALWLVVGIAYAGGRWGEAGTRMNFIRFSGELFIYYVLIALGGGVLTGFMALIFKTIAMDIGPFFLLWLLPCGAAGAVIIAAWLVEAEQSMMENITSMLARLFTPLFTIVLITFLGTLLWTGRGVQIERDVLIAFNMLLVVVLGLLLYSVAARDPQSPPGAFDVIQTVLVLSALIADAVALWAISARITDLGITPNRIVALGLNMILLVNLIWSAILYIRFLRGRGSFPALEQWQTDYLPVYAVWAAIVVIIVPPLFGFL